MLEAGTQALIRLMEEMSDGEKLFSSIAVVEVRSAIRRRQRAGDIQSLDANAAIGSLIAESRRMVEQPVTPSVIENAQVLIDRHVLRALDALQLATCIAARASLRGRDVCFVCSDQVLLRAARAEQFEVLDPETMV